MLFHVTWTLSPDQRDAAQTRFKETGAPPPDGVTMLGRWHCAEGLTGFAIADCSDAVAIGKWAQSWTDILTFEITPVLTDEQFIEVASS